MAYVEGMSEKNRLLWERKVKLIDELHAAVGAIDTDTKHGQVDEDKLNVYYQRIDTE